MTDADGDGGGVTAEAAAQAEGFKAEGNRLLAAKELAQAVEMYSRAIDLDPDNAVYFSNRSAAFLAMGDARGKALRDAERCIELRPDWWKGYSRKGAAEHALQRFDAARATYNAGLQLDPDNVSLAQAAEEAYAAGQAHSQRLREQAKDKERLEKAAEERKDALEREKREAEAAKKEEPKDEDDLLAAFMSEVQEIEESANCVKKDVGEEDKKKEKPPVDFGTPEGQVERLLQPHFAWVNLNPFRVLMLDTDATEEDMKQHYRKISTMIHPDKCRDPRAREAFEEVKKAYNLILQEDRRKIIILTIENATEKVEKERRAKLKKGVKERDLGDLKDEVEKAVLRAFAEIENRRRNIETREAALRQRETQKLDKEQKEMTDSYKRERTWAEEDRREHRVGNWRGFQKGGKRRKEPDAHGWKEEKRGVKHEHGVVDNDEYKRKWK